MNDNYDEAEELEFEVDPSHLDLGYFVTDEVERVMKDYGIVSDNDIIESISADYDSTRHLYEVTSFVTVG